MSITKFSSSDTEYNLIHIRRVKREKQQIDQH